MNKEIVKLVEGLSLAVGITALATTAFSFDVRRQIGKRANWHCEEDGCEKSFQTGWMVQAAHKRNHHKRDDPLYNDPSSGRCLCIEHHLQEHEAGTNLGKAGDTFAIRALLQTDDRTFDYRKNPMNFP